MTNIERLLLENKAWAQEKLQQDPAFFQRLSRVQTPEFLWIGCSDSRVAADRITASDPGTLFVHRNIANLVVTSDINMLSVLQYAVDVLQVKHVIVCGHYGCGGITAALNKQQPDIMIANKWLKHIKDTYRLHRIEIAQLPTQEERVNRLVELNVIEQVQNLAHTSIVQKAWKTRNGPRLHGWVYGLNDGIIKELATLDADADLDPLYQYDF
ncbi:carbonate dehydratase [Methylogaea oryzae]|uniref:Carbonic anhydrase n=1 Tax=Methylogaea oryzae TaxID=1295382 RepID=A0A8D4VNA7_9GAMM|nr:carbonate dehydratase [Methylogaea oryzae]BBL70746.1 carbonic anhydrase [Methylogaea oryzae]